MPNMSHMSKNTMMIAAGAVGGAALNRIGLSQMPNFYLRNGARVLAAALLSTLKGNQLVAVAAAGAVLAPIVPEVEMQLATRTATKNPHELAAELADLLEADLSDELEDDMDLSDDELSDDTEVSW